MTDLHLSLKAFLTSSRFQSARPGALATALLFTGCGGSGTTSESSLASEPSSPVVAAATATPTGPVTPVAYQEVDVEDADDLDDDTPPAPDLVLVEPDRGTPEWMIREITKLRVPAATNSDEPEPETQQATLQAQRQRKIIELATQAIANTHQDPAKEQIFNNAVHYLTDTRLQMALAGDQDQANLLTDDAESLYKRNATSFAAVEAATKVLQLTQAQAEKFAAHDSQWATAYSRQARVFAERFPQESMRAPLNLLAASRFCDGLMLDDESKACLSVIEEKFPKTPFADQSEAALRRLRLPGHPLTEFGGSTPDGGFVSIDQYQGKAVLIAFWASNSSRFRGQLPVIQAAQQKYGDRFAVLGVNFDRDERAVDRFLEETGISWKHVFYSDPAKRGPNNLVARHYGVVNVPSYWLIDPRGVVRSVNLNVDGLDRAVAETLR